MVRISMEVEDIEAEDLVLGVIDPELKQSWDSSISDMKVILKNDEEKFSVIYFALNVL